MTGKQGIYGRIAPVVVVAARKQAAIDIDDEGDQNKKQKLSNSVATTTAKDAGAGDGASSSTATRKRAAITIDDECNNDDCQIKKQKYTFTGVIPTTLVDPIQCCCCSKTAEVSWASNLDPEDNWDICEACQVVEFGELPLKPPNGRQRPPK